LLDFSDDAFEAQLVQPGTYDGQLADARQVGHDVEPRFDGYDALIAAVIGKPMRVIVGRGTKAGMPVAKVVGLLPPAAEDR
jgi:hypothetical protein